MWPAVVWRRQVGVCVGTSAILGWWFGRGQVCADPSEARHDPFRDGPLRYAGYANEFGEAFRKEISLWAVRATYAIAIVYGLADACDKGYLEYKKCQVESPSSGLTDAPVLKRVCSRALDVGLWQMAASVFLPALCVNRTCYVVTLLTVKLRRLYPALKYAPILAGLSIIPLAPHVIDPLVDGALDHTIRKVLPVDLGSE